MNRDSLKKQFEKACINNDKIKILIIDTDFIAGGPFKTSINIAKELSKHNYSFYYIATKYWERPSRWKEKFYDKFDGVYDLRYFLNKKKAMLKIIFMIKPSIILLINSKISYQLLPILKNQIPNVKIISKFHTEDAIFNYAKNYYHCIDKTIVVSQQLKNLLLNSVQDNMENIKIQNNIHLIFEGIENVNTHNTSSRLSNIYNISKNSFLLTFIGSIADHKDPLKLIDIAVNLNEDDDILLFIAGEGPLSYELQNEIIRKNLENKVFYLGHFDDIFHLLSLSNLLILPSKIEGTPFVIIESMSIGVPAIATNVGAIDEIIDNDINGFLINRDDDIVKNFSEKILFLKNNGNQYLNMQISAINKIHEKFNYNTMLQKYDECFKNTLFN